MKRIRRVGVIGAGQIVENAHLPVLLNLPGVEVRWIADMSPKRTALLSKMYRLPVRDLGALDAMLDDVDVCLIATPVGVRAPYLDACARKEKGVLTEKPFALSATAHQALCDRFPPHALGVCFQRRFYASLSAIQTVVKRRLFGKLESISFGIGGLDLKSGGPTRYLGDPKLSGGGVVMDLGVHVLDQVLVATEASAVDVQTVRSIAMDGIDYEAIVDATLETEHGPVPVHGEMTRLRPLGSGFVFTFENATIRFSVGPEATLSAVARDGGPSFHVDSPEGGATTAAQAFFALWTRFIDGLERSVETPVSATTSIVTARWVDGIYAKMVTQ